MKNLLSTLFVSILCVFSQAQQMLPVYKNKMAPIEQRVKDLLRRMSVEEKAGQLNQLAGDMNTGPSSGNNDWQNKLQAISNGEVGSMLNVAGAAKTRFVQAAAKKSRLGIPLLFGFDVIHGYKTIFPIPLAEACSWDLKQIERNAIIAAKETASSGIHWTFAPMCDISTDPRWGRVMEGIGEDPWYGAQISAARVKGFQGNFDNTHILACVKHYAAYGAVEGGNEYAFVDLSREVLWNKYLPPYKAAIDAGAATVMNGFTTFEGVPVSASKYLITDILKNKWNFKGFLVSDWGSFGEMINWGYATNNKDVAYKAFKAGSMMDMESKVIIKYIPELLKEKKITMAQLDDAVGRILYYKFKLGLFENPDEYCNEQRESTALFADAHKTQALEAAKRSIVLLKNNNQVLPLKIKEQKIALIGKFALDKDHIFDFWSAQGEADQAVSLYEGLNAIVDKSNISYSDGYKADASTSDNLIQQAISNAQVADIIVVNIGLSGKVAGEARSLAYPEIPKGQIELLQALKKTGKPVVAVVSAGRPLVLTQIQPLCDAILYTWILGTESGNAVAQVLSGRYNPSGKTVMSFPYAIGQIPIYYNHFNTGRPATGDNLSFNNRYTDIPIAPLYPFGYGLSYTHFTYSNFSLSHAELKKGGVLHIKVTITNNGSYDGEEVVQLYIHDVAASIIRPVKELKGFQKIFLKKGESKTIVFPITSKELSFYDGAGNIILEPGKFEISVGGNSRDLLKGDFVLL